MTSPLPAQRKQRQQQAPADVAATTMLSAFTARPIIELRQKDKSKIETILAYGELDVVSRP